MAKRGNTTALKAFRKKVEAIQAKSGISYRAAQKQASKKHRGRAKPRRASVKRRKKAHRKTARPKRIAGVKRIARTKSVRRTKGSTINNHIAKAKKGLAEQLGVAEMKRIASTTRKAFHHQTKRVKELRSKILRLC